MIKKLKEFLTTKRSLGAANRHHRELDQVKCNEYAGTIHNIHYRGKVMTLVEFYREINPEAQDEKD